MSELKGQKIDLSQDLSDLEYLKLTKLQGIVYDVIHFFKAVPAGIGKFFVGIVNLIKNFFGKIAGEFKDIFVTFKEGDFKTRLSFLIMGFGSITRGQILRGILFLVFEIVFIVYMAVAGFYWLGKFRTLGDAGGTMEYDPILDTYVRVAGDDSFKILLYGLLTIIFIISFIYTWRLNVKQNKIAQDILKTGKKLKSGKEDLQSLVDDEFHKTLLALPLTGIAVFTVFPIIFMIFVAFTNYDGAHDGYANLFTWVGMNNFNELFSINTGTDNLSVAFGEILSWTLMWAFFATFTNYFLGMFVAIMINKKGIKLKKMWRGILVLTSAVPQFVSLLYISKMFATNGLLNGMLLDWGIFDNISQYIRFWEEKNLARIMVIIINIWIGIPYLMLIATGILMNIPADLYESAAIDGANTFQQYTKITLPYMLFVTGPYLLTSFIGNINNFNVIFLLTGGGPKNPALLTSAGAAGDTDLLITWLFNITTGAESKYYMASVIGIMIFVVVSTLSLISYNLMPSTRNEEDFS
ncbi:MAG: sugar ABC transporter permease [Erysipelotrichaceae bacterium]|jgi:arabinogalactan oligomer/maltooligosaccharide transport system permease protein|nr:sugar ABC transporter permease [Erysipelotrichaceae bacterium]MBQ1303296.1 sugar ABC transporter permease [Erysipelotrichaceae bacterium]MBQ2685984.1 sugar ABC transporter permease [Erysipelotrichaceae bacterium]MBR2791846.1 sugar ABC transporter permease [Erysipelotrichaceae bacterium]MBR2827306.1 sugar ABC transporter permease [Erysipelotrichaceae bacterium]